MKNRTAGAKKISFQELWKKIWMLLVVFFNENLIKHLNIFKMEKNW